MDNNFLCMSIIQSRYYHSILKFGWRQINLSIYKLIWKIFLEIPSVCGYGGICQTIYKLNVHNYLKMRLWLKIFRAFVV